MFPGPIEIPEDGSLRFTLAASTTETITARVHVKIRGKIRKPLDIEFAHTTGDRSDQAFPMDVPEGSEIVGMNIFIKDSTTSQRGQVYVRAFLMHRGVTMLRLARGYMYDGGDVSLGQDDEPGPGGGEGFVQWLEVFTPDRAGNGAAVDFALAAANAFRKVYGLAWFYHCSADVAGRTFNTPSLQNPGGAKPTGWTTSGNSGLAWSFAANITLTADEEGMFYVNAVDGKDGRAAHVDNGAITVISSASNPTPFPLLVTEDELGVMRFPAIAAGEALDTHSAYLLVEEWIVL